MILRILPPRPFLGSIFARAVLVWAFLRAVIAAAAMMGAGPVLSDSVVVSAGLAVLVVGVTFVDMVRRSELLFLANLGHPFRNVSLVVVAECVVLEAMLRAVVG
jgi:hypothetical protein